MSGAFFIRNFHNYQMKKLLLPIATAAVAIASSTAADRKADPSVMTINGKDIKQSEFEYLYNKNYLQQMSAPSLDEYIDMFVLYKLKVAEAEAAGLDTTVAFRDEFNGYCRDLSAPYLRDSIAENRLYEEAYSRMKVSREVSHILLPYSPTKEGRESSRAKLDSIRNEILAGADFGEMALKYSYDRSAIQNHGNLGFINANTYPYPFEKVAYSTPVGEISEVFEDAPYGFHIVKVTAERPAVGEVSARHILKLTQGLSSEEASTKKSQIDSIAKLLNEGADFETLARNESEDPGSASRGGNLGFFGRGVMVPEFEDAAYSLRPGQISAPFATAYGYHIVQTLDFKPIPNFEESRPMLSKLMERDGRKAQLEKQYLESVRKEIGVSVSDLVMKEADDIIAHANSYVNALESLKSNQSVISKFPDGEVKVCDVAAQLSERRVADLRIAFEEVAAECVDNHTLEFAREQLKTNNSEYRNILNEYRDGILLFEISNRRVWDRASTDAEARNSFFAANRDKYSWDTPHFKGYVVLATNDSIASEAKRLLASTQISTDSLAHELFSHFGQNVKLEKVLTAKGENPIIDYIAFGGPQASPVGKWTAWFPYSHKILEAPEEADDVKGPLSTDLQQQLESEWIKELRAKYKVKINKKAIKKLVK